MCFIFVAETLIDKNFFFTLTIIFPSCQRVSRGVLVVELLVVVELEASLKVKKKIIKRSRLGDFAAELNCFTRE